MAKQSDERIGCHQRDRFSMLQKTHLPIGPPLSSEASKFHWALGFGRYHWAACPGRVWVDATRCLYNVEPISFRTRPRRRCIIPRVIHGPTFAFGCVTSRRHVA